MSKYLLIYFFFFYQQQNLLKLDKGYIEEWLAILSERLKIKPKIKEKKQKKYSSKVVVM